MSASENTLAYFDMNEIKMVKSFAGDIQGTKQMLLPTKFNKCEIMKFPFLRNSLKMYLLAGEKFGAEPFCQLAISSTILSTT